MTRKMPPRRQAASTCEASSDLAQRGREAIASLIQEMGQTGRSVRISQRCLTARMHQLYPDLPRPAESTIQRNPDLRAAWLAEQPVSIGRVGKPLDARYRDRTKRELIKLIQTRDNKIRYLETVAARVLFPEES